jgi:hypothetical protein
MPAKRSPASAIGQLASDRTKSLSVELVSTKKLGKTIRGAHDLSPPSADTFGSHAGGIRSSRGGIISIEPRGRDAEAVRDLSDANVGIGEQCPCGFKVVFCQLRWLPSARQQGALGYDGGRESCGAWPQVPTRSSMRCRQIRYGLCVAQVGVGSTRAKATSTRGGRLRRGCAVWPRRGRRGRGRRGRNRCRR